LINEQGLSKEFFQHIGDAEQAVVVQFIPPEVSVAAHCWEVSHQPEKGRTRKKKKYEIVSKEKQRKCVNEHHSQRRRSCSRS
jgi:hypothetical protein